MNQIDSITFVAPIHREYSSSSHVEKLGEHESTMTLYGSSDEPGYCIEWDIPSLEEVIPYGIWVDLTADGPVLADYDGGFNLPKQAIALLRANGIIVPADFE